MNVSIMARAEFEAEPEGSAKHKVADWNFGRNQSSSRSVVQ